VLDAPDDDDAAASGLLASDAPASAEFAATFMEAIANHRFWDRVGKNRLDAIGRDRETRGCGAPPEVSFGPSESPHH
jgi:hypothetical protein